MRIARISNMHQPFPPAGYGGTQRVMSQMTYFQAMQGHDVILYGPSDSTIEAATIIIAAKYGFRATLLPHESKIVLFDDQIQLGSVTFRTTGYSSIDYEDLNTNCRNNELLELLIQDHNKENFDVIHSHSIDLMPRLIEAGLRDKTVCQLHNLNLRPEYKSDPYPVVALSQYHADYLIKNYDADILGVSYHGMDRFNNEASHTHAGYVAGIGRFDKSKGLDLAVRAAKLAKKPMILAGTAQGIPAMEMYFSAELQPYIDCIDKEFLTRHRNSTSEEIAADIEKIGKESGNPYPIIFVGPASDEQKQVLYSNAQVTLFPIRWEEPFGLVMIESMSCGTPVIANMRFGDIKCGSVAEVIDEGLSGFRIEADEDRDCLEKMVSAISFSKHMDRIKVRSVFEERWTSEKEAEAVGILYQAFFERQRSLLLNHKTNPLNLQLQQLEI